MNRDDTPTHASPQRLARLLALAVVPLVGLAFCRFDAAEHALPPPSAPAHPIELAARCPVQPAAARVHAEQLEQLSEARSERAPFAPGELPDALAFMREAEACYAVAEAREARARTRLRADQLEHELTLRIRRTALALELARREQRLAELSRAADTLRALYGRAGPDAASYRAWLERLARSSQAAVAQAARERK